MPHMCDLVLQMLSAFLTRRVSFQVCHQAAPLEQHLWSAIDFAGHFYRLPSEGEKVVVYRDLFAHFQRNPIFALCCKIASIFCIGIY